MIGWLLATVGTAALGSVLPVVNIELYLVGVVSTVDSVPWWALALAATVGQIGAKSVFFFAGQGSFTLGSRLGRRAQAPAGSRVAAWMERIHTATERRPWWGLGVLLAGAITGLPPFTLMCFVSGAAGLRFVSWFAVSLVGRTLHFLLVAGAPELIRHVPLLG